MAGKTPHQAVRNCLDPLNQAVSCVTKDILVASGSDVDIVESLTLNNGNPSKLNAKTSLYLTVKMLYRVAEATGDSGPWKVSTAAYYYALHGIKERELLAFHWHPETDGQTAPHLHLYDASEIMGFLAKVHFPTGRIALEQFLRFLITELDVRPRRSDWERILNRTQAAYERYRSWPR